MSAPTPLTILGAGAFGTGLACAYAQAGHPVTLWGRNVAEMRATRRAGRLGGLMLPDGITVTGTLPDSCAIALLALPTQSLGSALSEMDIEAEAFVSCAKGIDRATGLRPTQLVARHRPDVQVAQLTGPSFAIDIARGLPTALTLGCADDTAGAALQRALSTPTLRLYRSTDVVGVELGGALKNVIAIAAGAVCGAGYGDSARAAVIARGFAEMSRIARDAGAQEETLTGLSGLGDLVLTCTTEKSRNFRHGMALAKGAEIDPAITVEGVHTARQMAATPRIDTPLSNAVAAMADGRADVASLRDALFNRPLKPE